jgi:hypothetical protein
MKLSNLALAALFLPTLAFAYAGGDSSGGGDVLTRDPGDAWFVGKGAPFSYCIQISPDFGVTADFARARIDRAFATWSDYLARKVAPRWKAEQQPSTNAAFQASCSAATDVTFYLGVSNADVKKGAVAYQDPVAFEYRQSHADGRSRGFVWVSSRTYWGKLDNLQAILLHETGHLLGNAHVSGTIMDAGIANVLKDSDTCLGADANWCSMRQTHVDQMHELVVGPSASMSGIISWASGDGQSDIVIRSGEETFKLMTGRDPVGGTFASWSYSESESTTGFGPAIASKVTLRDRSGSVEFPLTIATRYTVDMGSSMVMDTYPAAFFTIYPPTRYLPSRFPGGVPRQLYGTVTAISGRVFPVIVERNSAAPSPVRIMYVDGASAYELMVTRFADDTSWQPYSNP